MKLFLLKHMLFFKRIQLLESKKELYRNIINDEDKIAYQIKTFNIVWEDAQKHPFYKQWKEKYNLPTLINTPEDLKKFPKLTKRDIQENKDLIFSSLENYSVTSTGGSTGQPMKFPTSKEEKNIEYATTYLGRSWWGIKPFNNILVFWGHSHLFGTGLYGKLNQFKRIVSDWVVNMKRFNAYDMTISTLKKYSLKLFSLNPDLIIGYTSLNYKLAKYMLEHNLPLGNKKRLKGIICTSESVSDEDIYMINLVFQKPVILEYGMAECSVIAYSKDHSRNIELFWDSFIGILDSNNVLCISTLYKRKFPLINYCTDDMIYGAHVFNGSLLKMTNIVGREQVCLSVKSQNQIDNYELSGILIVHILKSQPHIYSVNFEQLTNNSIKINLISDVELNLMNIKNYLCVELKKDHPDVDESSILLTQSKIELKTIAGKEKLI